MKRALTLMTVVALLAGCGGESRETRQPQELLELRRQRDEQYTQETHVLFDRLIAVAKSEQDEHAAGHRPTPPTIDVLVISGGGDWGAFGTGFLKGWGTLPSTDPLARPTFDVVTGVSTGALIAPFAFVGDEASIDRVDSLYRNPKPDWVASRGWFYFLPSNISFASIPGLEREVREVVDVAMVRKIADSATDGRILAVNTTNLDDGGAKAFNLVAEARAAAKSGKLDRIHDIMLASAGIPGVFPFRLVDGEMLVDGGVTGNIIYGGRIADQDTIPAVWQRTYPGVPIPRIRYWVIFNNQLRTGPKTVEPRWPAVVGRSLELSVRYSTLTAMRHLLEQSRYLKLARGADIEVRIVAIPDDWNPAKEGAFVKETMNDLADVGRKLGADPKSWITELP